MDARYLWLYRFLGFSVGWLLGSHDAALLFPQPVASCVFDLLCR